MARCPRCRHQFRTLDDEEGQHECPSCGYHPDDEREAERHRAELLRYVLDRGFDLSTADDDSSRGVDVRCSQCEALVISGIATHERGCPHTPIACEECGELHRTRAEARACCADIDLDPDDVGGGDE